MGRVSGVKNFFNFTKGWNTEASPMTYPEGTASDLDNVILDVDGSVRRRPGVDFEADPVGFGEALTAADTQTLAFSMHAWEDVAGTESTAFFVTQVGGTLYVHRQGGDDASQNSIGTVALSTYSINAQEYTKSPILTANGSGVLFVTGKYLKPFYIEWDGTTLSTTGIDCKVRDFDGQDDGLDVESRPSTLSHTHLYNLLNQGWDVSRLNTFAGATAVSGTEGTSLSVTGSGTEFPSNADIVYLGMTTDSNGDLIFKKTELEAQTFGNTPAPNGSYILDLFQPDRESITGLTGGLTNTQLSTRFATCAFHNGRIFFAGLSDTNFANKVYFSQQLTSLSKSGKFYQEQDPTAEEFNDLLATDGGALTIPDSGKVLRLIEGPRGILAFSTNGVWQIAGTEGSFNPTNASVTKVTNIGCVGAETVVDADGTYFYWSVSGIVALLPDQITGNLTAQVISKDTIQTGYLLVGGLQQKFARGAYMRAEKKVVWMYSTDSTFDGVTDRYKYNGFLVFDTTLGAFYKYTVSDLSSNTPFIFGIVNQQPFVSTTTSEVVTVT